MDGKDEWWVDRLSRVPRSWPRESIIPQKVATIVAEDLAAQGEESAPVIWVDAGALAVTVQC